MTLTELLVPRIAILGNVGPDTYAYTTENEYLAAYQATGVDVSPYKEQDPAEWDRLIKDVVSGARYDFIQWTSTPSYRQAAGDSIMWQLIAACRRTGTPIIGVHLDRFFGIKEREEWLRSDPYFRGVDLMFTADGGDHPWEDYDIRHRWLLPAVSQRWCKRGEPDPDFTADVAFVGSWQGGYHHNSRHRHELVNWLQRYGADFWPKRGQEAIRGPQLTSLYWSTKLLVGDSFFAGGKGTQPPPRYGSDRTPETLGRGGILLHPEVEGWNTPNAPFATQASLTWTAWDFDQLKEQIETVLNWSWPVSTRRRNASMRHIIANHTYEKRVEQIMALLKNEGLT